MSTTALSPDSAPSSPRGFLVSARRKKGNSSASPAASVASNDDSGGSQRGGLRSSLDSSGDGARSAILNKTSITRQDLKNVKGLFGRQRSKRRRKGKDDLSDEAERGRSVAERGTLEPRPKTTERSRSRLTAKSESSLVTGESDDEPLETPPLVSRPSHTGYLTLSSPLIHQTTAKNDDTSVVDGPTDDDVPLKKLPESVVPVEEPKNLAPTHAATLPTTATSSGSVSPNTVLEKNYQNDRNASPAGKLKEGIGGIFGKKVDGNESRSRRGSAASQRLSNSQESSTGKASTSQTLPRPQSARGILPSQRISTSSEVPESPTTPTTTVTPPTPTQLRNNFPPRKEVANDRPKPSAEALETNPNISVSSSGHMISHRRVRSASATHPPSKLSNSISAPLTPTPEESRSLVPTPGAIGSGQTGFFSSVFSAASNAATTFSNSIANNPLNATNRSRSGTLSSEKQSSKSVIEDAPPGDVGTVGDARETADGEIREQKPLAVETLGSGSLSLSHLGLATEPASPQRSMSMNSNLSGALAGNTNGESPALAREGPTSPVSSGGGEDVPRSTNGSVQGLAATDVLGEKSLTESARTPIAEDVVLNRGTSSLYEASLADDQTPPSTRDAEQDVAIKRSGSVRSKPEYPTRKRGGSTATGTTVATAPGILTPGHGQPVSSGSIPRLTGFAVASKKRNKEFHQLFRSVPEDDYLIEDYSAAIQRDILLHGRFYVSEGHICFYSNIFGFVTTLIISFDEVVSVEKKSTAMFFPNAIVVQTLHARNTFASFASRDSTYDLLVGIWKISHPNLRSSLNGVQLDEAGGGDKTVAGDVDPDSDEESDEFDEQEDIYDEDAEDDLESHDLGDIAEASITGSDFTDKPIKPASRKASAAVLGSSGANGAPANGELKIKEVAGSISPLGDFPGPAVHAPTDCGDQDTHYERIIKEDTIPAPLGKVYSLIFGPSSGAFMMKWLLDDQKVLDLEMEDDKKGLNADKKTRSYSYTKPLNGSIGPRSTKCLITETLDQIDLDKAVSVTVVTQTPDVPSGNAFSVKTKYCLTWGPGNGTKLMMNCNIEWTAKSWLKGPIEKGATDGQIAYAGDLLASIKTTISARLGASAAGAKKLRKKRRDAVGLAGKSSSRARDGAGVSGARSVDKGSPSWGLLEPLRRLLGPFVEPLRPLMTQQLALVFMTFVAIALWLRQSSAPYGPVSRTGAVAPERVAAYEELWRQEESHLWDWLEERIGLDNVAQGISVGDNGRQPEKLTSSQRQQQAKNMNERDLNEAIRTTQDRLDTLKDILGDDGKSKEEGHS